jgi:hypothetical protein
MASLIFSSMAQILLLVEMLLATVNQKTTLLIPGKRVLLKNIERSSLKTLMILELKKQNLPKKIWPETTFLI